MDDMMKWAIPQLLAIIGVIISLIMSIISVVVSIGDRKFENRRMFFDRRLEARHVISKLMASYESSRPFIKEGVIDCQGVKYSADALIAWLVEEEVFEGYAVEAMISVVADGDEQFDAERQMRRITEKITRFSNDLRYVFSFKKTSTVVEFVNAYLNFITEVYNYGRRQEIFHDAGQNEEQDCAKVKRSARVLDERYEEMQDSKVMKEIGKQLSLKG